MVEIEGHTDSYGRDAANQVLSEERAEAVFKYLAAASSSISSVNVKAVGYGEKHPVASNETAEGRAQNRQIEIVVKEAKRLDVSTTKTSSGDEAGTEGAGGGGE